MWLFSYGSNHPDQIAERLGHRVTTQGAVLENHVRVFRGWSQRWGGGVASLQPKQGGEVYGLVAKVTAADLTEMDRFEGVASGNYKRKRLQVVLADGTPVDAVAYVSTSTKKNAPTREYLEAVAKTIGTHWSGDGGAVSWRDITVRENPIAAEEMRAEEMAVNVDPLKEASRLLGDTTSVANAKGPVVFASIGLYAPLHGKKLALFTPTLARVVDILGIWLETTEELHTRPEQIYGEKKKSEFTNDPHVFERAVATVRHAHDQLAVYVRPKKRRKKGERIEAFPALTLRRMVDARTDLLEAIEMLQRNSTLTDDEEHAVDSLLLFAENDEPSYQELQRARRKQRNLELGLGNREPQHQEHAAIIGYAAALQDSRRRFQFEIPGDYDQHREALSKHDVIVQAARDLYVEQKTIGKANDKWLLPFGLRDPNGKIVQYGDRDYLERFLQGASIMRFRPLEQGQSVQYALNNGWTITPSNLDQDRELGVGESRENSIATRREVAVEMAKQRWPGKCLVPVGVHLGDFVFREHGNTRDSFRIPLSEIDAKREARENPTAGASEMHAAQPDWPEQEIDWSPTFFDLQRRINKLWHEARAAYADVPMPKTQGGSSISSGEFREKILQLAKEIVEFAGVYADYVITHIAEEKDVLGVLSLKGYPQNEPTLALVHLLKEVKREPTNYFGETRVLGAARYLYDAARYLENLRPQDRRWTNVLLAAELASDKFSYAHLRYLEYEARRYGVAPRQGPTAAIRLSSAFVNWEYDDLPWDGEPPAPDYVLYASVRDTHGNVIASLGGIGVNSTTDPYLVQVENELLAEAIDSLRGGATARENPISREAADDDDYGDDDDGDDALICMGRKIIFELDGGEDIELPPRWGMLHDPEGTFWPKCSLLFVAFKQGQEEVDTAEGRGYFGRKALVTRGRVKMPPNDLKGWREIGIVKQVFYERAGTKAPGKFHHEFNHPTGMMWLVALFKKRVSETPCVLFEYNRGDVVALRLELPDGCVVDDRGIALP